MKQNIIKKILITVIIVLSCGLVLSYALNSNIVINFITNSINKQLQEVSYTKLNFQILKIQVFPLSLNMYGIDLTADLSEKDSTDSKNNKDSSSIKSLTKLSRLTIKPSLKAFILGKIKLAVEVSDMDLSWPLPVEIDDILKSNTNNSKKDSNKDNTNSLENIPIDYISIINSNISATIKDEEDLFQIYALGINTKVKISSLNKIKSNLDISKFSFKYNDMRVLEEAHITSSVVYQDKAFKLDSFSLKEDKLLARGTLFGSVKEGVYSLLENNSGNIFQKSIRQIISGKIQKIGLSIEENLNKFINIGEKNKVDTAKSKSKYLDIEGSLEVESDFSTVGRILNIDNSKGYFKSDNLQLRINIPFSSDETLLSIEAPIIFKDSYLSGFHLMDGSGILRSDQDFLYLADVKVSNNGKPVGIVNGSIGYEDVGLLDFKANIFDLKFVELMKILDVSFTDVMDFDLSTDNFSLEGTMEPLRLTIKAPVIAKSLEIFPVKPSNDSLKYNKPDCDVGLHLLVTDKFVSFVDNNLNCYLQDKNTKDKKLESKKTNIILSGKIDYDKGVDLSLESLNFNLKLIEYYLQSSVEGKADLFTSIYGNDSVKTSVYLKGAGAVHNVVLDEIDIKTFITSDSVLIEDSFLGVTSKKTTDNSFFVGQGITNSKHGIQVDKIRIDLNDSKKYEFNVSANNIDKFFVKELISNLSSESKSEDFVYFDINSLKINLISDPNKLLEGDGNISFLVKNGSLGEEGIFDKISSNIQIHNNKIDIKDFLYENLSLGLKLTGNLSKHDKKVNKKYINNFSKDLEDILNSIGFDIRDNISLNFESYTKKISNKSILQAKSIPILSSVFKKSDIDFNLSLNGNLTGSFQDPKLSYTINTDNMKILGSDTSSLIISGNFSDSTLTNNIKTSDDSFIGKYELYFKDKNTKYSFNCDIEQYDIRYLLTSVFARDYRNYAYISGSFSQSGTFPYHPKTGHLTIKDIGIKYNFYSKEIGYKPLFMDMSSDVFELEFKNNTWNIVKTNKLVLSGQHSELFLNFKQYSGTSLNLDLYSKINIEILEDLMDLDMDLTKGSIIASGEASFNDSGIKYDLKVFTEDKIYIGKLQPPIQDLSFSLNIDNNYIKLNNLFFKKGSGEVRGNGFINLNNTKGKVNEELSSYKHDGLHFKLKNVDMMYYLPVIKNLETSVSGDITVQGNHLPFKVSGNLRLDKTNSITSADIRDDIVNLFRESSYSVSSEIQENPKVDIDVHVRNGEPIHISNRNMDLDLSLDLDVKGTDISPSILGTLSIDKGKLIYRRDFNVTNGIITFSDMGKIDPNLDIQAISNIDSYQVSLKVGGSGSNPMIDFTIDPATYYDGSMITKMDILTLVMGGSLNRNKSTSVVDSEVSIEQTMSSEAVSILAGQLEKPLEHLFRRSGQSFVKQVYVDTYISNTGVSTPRFNFPINVSDDLGLLLKISNYDWRVSVDYSIEDNILVTGSYDQQRQNENEGSTVNVYNPIDTSVDVKFYFSFP